MDWNNLLTFALGGLTAVIPIIIANRYQAREKDKDRVEQRKEAKIQNRQKWIERDILKIMDSIDILLKFLWELERVEVEVNEITEGKKSEFFNQDEADVRLKSHYDHFKNLHNEVKHTADIMSKLIHSFDAEEEMYKVYTDFLIAIQRYEDARDVNKDNQEKPEEENWLEIQTSAGKLHALLRDKLISTRD